MNPPTDRTDFNIFPKEKKSFLGDLLTAQNWFNLFWLVQGIGYIMLFLGWLVFFPKTNPYFSVFASALAVLSFSWLGVAIAWRKLLKIISNI